MAPSSSPGCSALGGVSISEPSQVVYVFEPEGNLIARSASYYDVDEFWN